MKALQILPIVLSAIAIVVTVVIAIINMGKSTNKEEKEEAKEFSMALADINHVKTGIDKIQDDIRRMDENQCKNMLLLTKEIAKAQSSQESLEKRVDRLESDLKEVLMHG